MSSAPLSLSLDHVDRLLGRARGAGSPALTLARGAGGDPLFIDLPAYAGPGGAAPDRRGIEVMASLYFAAEVEATFLPAVAEELAKNRFGLQLTDRGAAEALEALARAMERNWVARPLRNQIYARVFGLGEADPNLGDAALNREFEPLFARFCAAAADAARDLQGWGSPGYAAMRLQVAAQAVLANLGLRMQGNTLIVTERLAAQLRLSIAALNHPGMTALFMGRTAWDVVRGVLGPDAPDLSGPVNQAQTGLRLLSWLAAHLDAVLAGDAQGIIDAVTGEPGIDGWARMWLDGAGVGGGVGGGRAAAQQAPAAPGGGLPAAGWPR